MSEGLATVRSHSSCCKHWSQEQSPVVRVEGLRKPCTGSGVVVNQGLCENSLQMQGCQPCSSGSKMHGQQICAWCSWWRLWLPVRQKPTSYFGTDVKYKGLDAKATAESAEPAHSPKMRTGERNKGGNAIFCCQPGCQRRQPSHSLTLLMTESVPSLQICILPAFLPTFSNLHCCCGEKSRLLLALRMWYDLQLQPEAVGTCLRKLTLFFKGADSQQCLKIRTAVKCVTLLTLELVWDSLTSSPSTKTWKFQGHPVPTLLWGPREGEATSFVPLFHRFFASKPQELGQRASCGFPVQCCALTAWMNRRMAWFLGKRMLCHHPKTVSPRLKSQVIHT